MTTQDSFPLVSVIIPVYNTEKYLRQCLDSVLRQTEPNIEVICVDDGSTDSSFEILEEYCAKDSRVVVIKQENKGVAVARNVGVTRSTGKYLFFADSDDELAPSLCRKTTEIAEKSDAQIVLAYPNSLVKMLLRRFPQFRRLYDPSLFKKGSLDVSTTNRRLLLSYFAEVCGCWNCLYRRDFWIERKLELPQGIRIGEDICVNVQAFAKVERVAFLSERLYYYRVVENSASHQNLGKRLGARVDLFRSYRIARDFCRKNAPELLPALAERQSYLWYKISKGLPNEELQIVKRTVDSLVDDVLLEALRQKNRLPFKARQFWIQFYGRSSWERIVASFWTRLFEVFFRLERFYKSKVLPVVGKRK